MQITRITRIQAFEEISYLRSKGLKRSEIINYLISKYNLPKGTLYMWVNNQSAPMGTNKFCLCREGFYVIGALLGDGCAYHWKNGGFKTILIGSKQFTHKYSKIISICTGKKVHAYVIRSKNVWSVSVGNSLLFKTFLDIRKNPNEILTSLPKNINQKQYALAFIEGFFDAEGCVKIIKEKSRKTPKICIDFTNTNKQDRKSVV